MRQINFLLIFALCLALALFSIENTQTAVIKLIPGMEIEAPVSIELILTLGIGAILAWLFGIWNRLQNQMEYLRQVRPKDKQIEKLEENMAQYEAELEQRQLSPATEGESAKEGATT